MIVALCSGPILRAALRRTAHPEEDVFLDERLVGRALDRGLPSPAHYVRWFRVLAAAYLLSDRDLTTLEAAHRLGFTTGGNFCRSIKAVTGFTSSEVRSVQGWNRLLVTFAWRYLDPAALHGWATLDDVFLRAAA